MKSSLFTSAAALVALAAPAAAQSVQAELAALRAKVDAQQTAIEELKGADKGRFVLSAGKGIELKFTGQINQGVLFTDDGENSDVFFVENDNSSTRLNITGTGQISDDLSAGTVFEVEIESNSTAEVNQNNTNTSATFKERKLEFFLASKTLGKLSVGQGDMASNATSESDLSGTTVVGYSAVEDLAGGIFFTNDANGALTTVKVGQAFDNFDGLSRQDRVRYDSPTFSGVTLSASIGDGNLDFGSGAPDSDDEIWDVAARYAGEIGSVKIDSAVAYATSDESDHQFSGSASLLHLPTGLSLTAAYAERDISGRDPVFYYVKLGWQTKDLSSWGKTAFAVDFAQNDDILALNDEAQSYGIFAVQTIDRINSELYAGVRSYEYSAPGAAFNDVTALLAGARIRF
ncbi:MAG: hypothetical protein CVT84_05355 [Alphaproteobacteria bacterium HGW-Alphaproteobacteria-6]|nr:MAG: hypothetical protein CVT84_05355 [Alphaproteobacteria bacterium HGW-Alphaproteobacteria-6]